MAGTQHFFPGDIQFQLVDDRGQCAEPSYLKLTPFFLHCESNLLLTKDKTDKQLA